MASLVVNTSDKQPKASHQLSLQPTHLCDDAQQGAAGCVVGLEPHQLVHEEQVAPARPRLTITQRQQQLVTSQVGGLHTQLGKQRKRGHAEVCMR